MLPLQEVITTLIAGQSLPDKTAVITFDDAYDSIYTQAFPLLKENGWPFTIFVSTQALETGLKGFLTWDQIAEMGDNGATIANHSHTHTHLLRRLEQESEAAWRKRIRTDIVTAQELIERHTGQTQRLFAYPYGEYNHAVKEIVSELDFVGFGQQSGPLPESNIDLLVLPRFPFGGAYGDANDFATKLATKPMPIEGVTVLSSPKGQALTDTLLPNDVDRPVLEITLRRELKITAQCFASGQGAIAVNNTDRLIVARANKPLPVGRSRYNCTAASDEAGRYFWYSQFFIRKQSDGNWYSEP